MTPGRAPWPGRGRATPLRSGSRPQRLPSRCSASCVEPPGLEPARRLERPTKPLDRVLVRRQRSTSSCVAVVRDLARVVTVVAIRDRLDERRARRRVAARSCAGARRAVDGADVLAVDLDGRKAEPVRTLARSSRQAAAERPMYVSTAYWLFSQIAINGSFCIAAKLTNSHVRPGVRAALSEEADADLAGLAELRGERRAHRDPERRADDPVRPEVAEREVVQVHRPAAPACAAGRAAPELGHHDAGGHALGECVVVRTVRAGDDVPGRERAHDADRDRLLAGGLMDAAGDLVAAHGQRLERLLELPDHEHRLEPFARGRRAGTPSSWISMSSSGSTAVAGLRSCAPPRSPRSCSRPPWRRRPGDGRHPLRRSSGGRRSASRGRSCARPACGRRPRRRAESARPTVSRLVWPSAMMPVKWSTPIAPRLESVEGGVVVEVVRARAARLALARLRPPARRASPAASSPRTSRTTGITTPCSVATASPTSPPARAPRYRVAVASARSSRSVSVGAGSIFDARSAARAASIGSASTSRVTAKCGISRHDSTHLLGDQLAETLDPRRRLQLRARRARRRARGLCVCGLRLGCDRTARRSPRARTSTALRRLRPGRSGFAGAPGRTVTLGDDLDDHGPDRDDRAGLEQVRPEPPRDRALELHRRLVGLDLGNRLARRRRRRPAASAT